MTTILKNARLIDPEAGTAFDGSVVIAGGRIAQIVSAGKRLPESAETIDCQGHVLAPGIVDIGVKVCEPGERHKESFRTAGAAAASGGVTTIVTRPDTEPAIDTPEVLEFVHRRAVSDSVVNVLPMAALTKARQGREMAEIGFLQDAGAVAFTDCDAVVHDPKVFARCLTYASSLGALVIGHVQDPQMSAGAAATGGALAARMGLPAVSPMAERMGLERDLALVEMTQASYHADQVSTAAALPALARAKEAGLKVTAGVSIHHLTLTEQDIEGYRTFFKVKPPLRTETDRRAMVEALASGLIDVVSSMHTPQDEESKRLPFDLAASGAVALETLLPAALSLVHAGDIDLPKLWRAMSLNPARLAGSEAGRLAEGAPADLVLFDPDHTFVMDRYHLVSKTKNTPFDERPMQGAVLRTFVAGQEVYSRPKP
ncbi:MAG: dihydroorotase [Pseudomonadota bacterium]